MADELWREEREFWLSGVAEAARKLWWLVQAARALQLTGVGLKDRSDLLGG